MFAQPFSLTTQFFPEPLDQFKVLLLNIFWPSYIQLMVFVAIMQKISVKLNKIYQEIQNNFYIQGNLFGVILLQATIFNSFSLTIVRRNGTLLTPENVKP